MKKWNALKKIDELRERLVIGYHLYTLAITLTIIFSIIILCLLTRLGLNEIVAVIVTTLLVARVLVWGKIRIEREVRILYQYFYTLLSLQEDRYEFGGVKTTSLDEILQHVPHID